MALDLGFLGTCYDCEDTFSQNCSSDSAKIFHYLIRSNFPYFLSTVYAWENSRLNNLHILSECLEKKQKPQLLGAYHTCIDCVSTQSPCNHKCCLKWYIETGVNCGFLSREDSTVVINHQQSIKLAKSEEIDNNFSLFDFPVLGFSAVKKRKNLTQGKECYPTKKVKKTIENMSLRPRRVYNRKTFKTTPKRVCEQSVERLKAAVSCINKKVKDEPGVSTFAAEMEETLNKWDQMKKDERSLLTSNVTYMYNIICADEQHLLQFQVSFHEGIFFQAQVANAGCGLCTLNNIFQKELFTYEQLNEIADKLWIQQILVLNMSPLQPLTPMRSNSGDYNITVLEAACLGEGKELKALNIKTLRNVKSLSSESILEFCTFKKAFPVSFVPAQESGTDDIHYTALHVTENSNYLLDSLKKRPLPLSSKELLVILNKLIQSKNPFTGMYVLTGIVFCDLVYKKSILLANFVSLQDRSKQDNWLIVSKQFFTVYFSAFNKLLFDI